MTVNLDDINQVPSQDRKELARNLKAIAQGREFTYQSVVGDKTYAVAKDLVQKILKIENREQPRTLKQLHAEAKTEEGDVGLRHLRELAEEQIAHPPKAQPPLFYSDPTMREAFQEAQKSDVDSFVKNIVERRVSLVGQDKNYVRKMAQIGEYSQLAAQYERIKHKAGELTKEEKVRIVKTLKNALDFTEHWSSELKKPTSRYRNPEALASMLEGMKIVRENIKKLNPQELKPTDAADLVLVPKALDKLEKTIKTVIFEESKDAKEIIERDTRELEKASTNPSALAKIKGANFKDDRKLIKAYKRMLKELNPQLLNSAEKKEISLILEALDKLAGALKKLKTLQA